MGLHPSKHVLLINTDDQSDLGETPTPHQATSMNATALQTIPTTMHMPWLTYMEVLGSIPDFSQYSNNVTAFATSKNDLLIDKIVPLVEVTELENKRQKYLASEENFHSFPTSTHGGYSYDRLEQACAKYESPAGMEQHRMTSLATYRHFQEKGMFKNDARSCAFVLALYSGSAVQGTINRNASLIARHGNGKVTAMMECDKFDDACVIMHYLTKALLNIDFYWGVVARAVDLSADELADYTPGNLVTWIQFSSSKKGDKPSDRSAHCNTVFVIYSLTGRCIKQFSNFPDEEEVLFPPHSSFLVCRVDESSPQTHIYLRQVELGFSKYSVMWVDDYIFFDWWENKEYMSKPGTVTSSQNVHYIPRADTESALAFLRSEFGQRLKNKRTFRIVTDMKRDEELPADNAGARLIKAVREMGFNNRCLVFTMNEETAWRKIKALVRPEHLHDVSVTNRRSVLKAFLSGGA